MVCIAVVYVFVVEVWCSEYPRIHCVILSASSSSAWASTVSELMLVSMWFPPVAITVVVLLYVLQVRME